MIEKHVSSVELKSQMILSYDSSQGTVISYFKQVTLSHISIPWNLKGVFPI